MPKTTVTKSTRKSPAVKSPKGAVSAPVASQSSQSAQAGAAAKTPLTKEFKHPLLDEARALAAKGALPEAAATLETLAASLKGNERSQVLCYAALMLKSLDNPRALSWALQATESTPKLTQAWMALATVYDDVRNRKETIGALQQALKTAPTPHQCVDVGRMLVRLGEQALGLEAVRKGYETSKGHLGLASYSLRVALQCADWELAGRITQQLRQAHDAGRTVEAAETPRTHVLWCADEATNIKVIQAFTQRAYPERERLVTQAWPDDGKRKLRIAYLSSDFRDHATSLLALGLMRHHDRSQFELVAYCTSYDDGSALRREMINRFDKARTIAKMTDRQAADLIVKDKIDVLIDLNGPTEGTRHGVLAWHPAPVQISYLGYPGTVGGRFVEYIIGDDYTVPQGAEQRYPEKIIRIPPTYQINDYVARYLPPAPTRQQLGLPADRPIVGMFNNVNKVHPEVWQTWMKILKQVPTAVLWMLDPGAVAAGHLRQQAKLAGIEADQLVFAPKLKQEAHLARMRQCDIVLDPWPYGGHTTTGDALFAGVAVVALQGTNFASRVSGGLLSAAGLSSLVMPTVESYVSKAVELINKPAELQKIKQYLRKNRSTLPVFDAPTRTRQLEAGYRAAHQRAVRGLPADHLMVNVKR
jgi:predicted O-linked N-acetylglucosamine transferase (SPINDLY family)